MAAGFTTCSSTFAYDTGNFLPSVNSALTKLRAHDKWTLNGQRQPPLARRNSASVPQATQHPLRSQASKKSNSLNSEWEARWVTKERSAPGKPQKRGCTIFVYVDICKNIYIFRKSKLFFVKELKIKQKTANSNSWLKCDRWWYNWMKITKYVTVFPALC